MEGLNLFFTLDYVVMTQLKDCDTHKQELSLKKIFGGSQILTILTQLSDEIPLYSLS